MTTEYLPVLFVFIFAGFIGVSMIVLSFLIGPRKTYRSKISPYECGIPPKGNARLRYPVKFYLVAMVFLVFDVEVVFLYPWAVVYNELKLFGLLETGVFIFILFLGFIYLWKKKAFEW